MNLKYDYSKLRGRIVEKYGSNRNFSKAMELSERTISLKLNNKIFWTQKEIEKAIDVLDLSSNDIQNYFFTN